jgi:hypothetical protein
MSLARQSSEVAQKDQQKVFFKTFAQLNWLAAQIHQTQVIDGELSHWSQRSAIGESEIYNKKGALRPSAPF